MIITTRLTNTKTIQLKIQHSHTTYTYMDILLIDGEVVELSIHSH